MEFSYSDTFAVWMVAIPILFLGLYCFLSALFPLPMPPDWGRTIQPDSPNRRVPLSAAVRIALGITIAVFGSGALVGKYEHSLFSLWILVYLLCGIGLVVISIRHWRRAYGDEAATTKGKYNGIFDPAFWKDRQARLRTKLLMAVAFLCIVLIQGGRYQSIRKVIPDWLFEASASSGLAFGFAAAISFQIDKRKPPDDGRGSED
jgi:hypothetical protein